MRLDPRFALALALLGGCDGPPPAVAPTGALRGHSREVTALAFSPDGKTLASRSSDAVKLWDVSGLAESRSLPSDGADFGSLAFAPDGKTLAANKAGVGAVAWDVATGSEAIVYREPPRASGPAPAASSSYGWGLSYAPDGRTLAGGGSRGGLDGFVNLWDVAAGGEGRPVLTTPSPVTTVAYSPDGQTIAIGSMSGNVELYEPAARLVRAQLRASRAYLAPVAFSPDGGTLATASEDRSIRLWDVRTGRESRALKGHMKGVFGLAFHPDGRTLASGDAGGTIFLWDVASRRTIASLVGHRGKVYAVAFRPDGSAMASAGEDGEIRLWDTKSPAAHPGR